MTLLNIAAHAPHVQVRDALVHDVCGSGIFATKSFSLGDTIVTVNAPMIVALDKDRLTDTCYQCFRQAGDIPPEAHLGFPPDGSEDKNVGEVKLNRCAGCKVVRYCGKVCGSFRFRCREHDVRTVWNNWTTLDDMLLHCLPSLADMD